jgi:uncharacterized MAPEG superfamily protein
LTAAASSVLLRCIRPLLGSHENLAVENIVPMYLSTLTASVVLACLLLLQFLVVDVSQIRAKQVPGMPVSGGHDNFLFRATRAHANTNESLGLYLLLIFCAVLLSADAHWTATAAWTFTAARGAHMVCYYFDWRNARSLAFGVGLLALIGLLVVSAMTLLQLHSVTPA